MSRYRTCHFARALILLALPVFLCGMGSPSLDLDQRLTALEAGSDETALAIEGLVEEVAALEEGSAETAAAIDGLSQRVMALEDELDELTVVVEQELGLGPRTVLFEDDFEDGIDPGWVQTTGTTVTIAPTSDCGNSYWTEYQENCGSLGLIFDEVERYEFQLPTTTPGILTLYFHDDASDRNALAFIEAHPAGGRLGVHTDSCPDHYWIALTHGFNDHCTSVPRRTGWQRVDLIRTGSATRGFINHILVFETKHPGRAGFSKIAVNQENAAPRLLDGFAIDDVRFEAFD